MLYLAKNNALSIGINPRWPQKEVIIDKRALDAVCKAQALLPTDIRLILTRAYQKESKRLKFLRRIGAAFFSVVYKHRCNETKEIFGHNGHGTNGLHVDIAILYKGSRLKLLPWSVFTPTFLIKRIQERYSVVIEQTCDALIKVGFVIHPNATEALQIHCDLNSV